MNGRRRALIGINQGIEPLYIYAEGESKLRNGTIDNSGDTSATEPDFYKFMPGALEIGVDMNGNNKDGFICITGVDFSKYTTLNIDCQSGRAISQPNGTYGSHSIGYTTGAYRLNPSVNWYSENGYVYTCRNTNRNIYTFDISNIVGDQVAIKAINEYGSQNSQALFSDDLGNNAGKGLFIYNIWLA